MAISELNYSLDSRVNEIILLPTTIPKDASKITSEKMIIAIKILNNTLENYVKRHSNNKVRYIYINLYKVFECDPPRTIFIDYCCHLSSYGAKLEAKAIAAHLRY